MLSMAFHWGRFKLVNGGSSSQVAQVFWQPSSSFISVLAGFPTPPFFFLFSFLIKAESFPIHILCVCLCLSLSPFLLPLLSFLPSPCFPPFLLKDFLVFGSLDDESVTTMSKLRSNTENRKCWCLSTWKCQSVSTKGNTFPHCDVMPGGVTI